MSEPETERLHERVTQVERDNTDLRVANARLAVSVDTLARTVHDLQESVTHLNSTLDRGRGALWASVTLAGAAGSVLTVIMRKLFGGP